jgi:hypothetical protein
MVMRGRDKAACRVTGDLIGTWWRRPLMASGRQVTCEHGLKVFLIDGNHVRNNQDSDFIQGNRFNASYIPAGEIWIDRSIPKTEIHHLILHECLEAEHLKKGGSLTGAYYKAKADEDHGRRTEKSVPLPLPVWKRSTKMTCEHGLRVFLVDGKHVRDEMDSAFVQGGNEFRYSFVPPDELWLDWHMPKAEWPYVLFHECYETEKMRGGWGYDRAHNAAKRAEDKMRRRDRPGQ